MFDNPLQRSFMGDIDLSGSIKWIRMAAGRRAYPAQRDVFRIGDRAGSERPIGGNTLLLRRRRPAGLHPGGPGRVPHCVQHQHDQPASAPRLRPEHSPGAGRRRDRGRLWTLVPGSRLHPGSALSQPQFDLHSASAGSMAELGSQDMRQDPSDGVRKSARARIQLPLFQRQEQPELSFGRRAGFSWLQVGSELLER